MAQNNMEKSGTPIRSLLRKLMPRPQAQPRRVRVGLAGRGPMLHAMLPAYLENPCVKSLALFHPNEKQLRKIAKQYNIETAFSDLDLFMDHVDAVEVFDLGAERHSIAESLLQNGRHVSLQKPFACSLEQADSLMAAASRGKAFLRVNDYSLFYEPYRTLRRLLREREIGEVCAVRIRSNLAGCGGWGPMPEYLAKDKVFFHPAFDKYALAMHLFGGVESVCCYANAMKPKKGGQAVVGCKFRAPGRYGVFEFTYAPDTEIRSEGMPVDDTLEVAGTDGIIWVNNFHGKLTEEPCIEVRRGKKHYTLGIGSGMAMDWEHSLHASATHFLSCIARGAPPELSAKHARKALAVQCAAARAARENAEIFLA
jgi:predicted dehydrogenase